MKAKEKNQAGKGTGRYGATAMESFTKVANEGLTKKVASAQELKEERE